VAARYGVFHEMWSDEAGAAENENAERSRGDVRRGGARQRRKTATQECASRGSRRFEEIAAICHGTKATMCNDRKL
jgi:hypothetical protein